MDTMYELTEAECEAVAGGTNGQTVALFNHVTGSGPGLVYNDFLKDFPGFIGPVGRLVSQKVDIVKTIPLSVPNWAFGLPAG